MLNNIRKYGLEYYDLPTMIWNVSIFLRAVCVNIDPRHKKDISIFAYMFTILFGVAYLYAFVLSMVWFVFWRCRETGDFLAATIIFSLGVSSIIGTAKLIFMIANRNDIRNIVDRALAIDALVNHNSRFHENMMVTLRKVKKRALLFWNLIMVDGFLYVVKPFMMPGRHLPEDTFVTFMLEPPLETPNYEISYVLKAAGVSITCFATVNITAFLIVIVGYVEAQMLALSEEIMQVYNDSVVKYNLIQNSIPKSVYKSETVSANDFKAKKEIINKEIKARLNEIIRIHTMNLNLIQLTELAFRGGIAIEFFILIIALIADLLGGLENTYIQIPFSSVQVGMDCITGQKLTDASIIFEKAVYDCKWEEFDVENRKTVLMILLNSQKTLKLSAGGITMLNFSSFMTIVRLVYSSYTTLRSTVY